jgi:hypothetical protein
MLPIDPNTNSTIGLAFGGQVNASIWLIALSVHRGWM